MIVLVIFTGWLAFAFDMLIIYGVSSSPEIDACTVSAYLARSIVYIFNIYLITRMQMRAEAKMRAIGGEIPSSARNYWYSSLCHYIPHFIVSSLLRVYSEVFPLMLFLAYVIYWHFEELYVLRYVGAAIFIYMFVFYIVQRYLSYRASLTVNSFVSQITFLNEILSSIKFHKEAQINFVVRKRTVLGSAFEKANSVSVSFSQSVRHQVELVAIFCLLVTVDISAFSTALIYIAYRLSSSIFQVISIVSSMAHYRVYYVDMKRLSPNIKFFGEFILGV